MELEKQVCSLESSKRLKELGVPQKSLFKWRLATDDKWYIERDSDIQGTTQPHCAAFTCSELGEILIEKTYCDWWLAKRGEGWILGKNKEDGIYGDTEVEARAECLIYHIENGFVKAGQPEGEAQDMVITNGTDKPVKLVREVKRAGD